MKTLLLTSLVISLYHYNVAAEKEYDDDVKMEELEVTDCVKKTSMGDMLIAHYTGLFTNGEEFDSR